MTSETNRLVVFKNELLSVPDKQPNKKPTSFELHSNCPNPFNPTTTLRYRLDQSIPIMLKVYNILG